jgi:hypothetical protein
MLPVSFIAIMFTVGLSVFLNTSFHSFKDYNHQLKDLSNWQETSLAAAKRVSAESSNLLSDVQAELNDCLTQYDALKKASERNAFQCETDFQDIVSNFKTSLKENYNNQLNSTIEFGLNPDSSVETYKSYSYKLYHSDRLPSALKAGDDLYNSTIASESDFDCLIGVHDIEYFLDGYKLNIDPEFLEILIGKDNADLIALAPAKFDLNISSSQKLKEENLPNAIKISVKFNQRNSVDFDKEDPKEDKLLTQNLLSAAQLRLLGEAVAVAPVVNACNTCGCPGFAACGGGGPIVNIANVRQQEITFSLFDSVSGRGIFFDNSQPASAQNKINIVNTSQGRFTSVYPGAGNFLQIDIGALSGNSVVISPNRTALIVSSQLDFASVTFQEAAPSGHTINVTNTQKINVDIVPRARKRYMTAQKDFVVNGKLIPKGTVLVGTLEPNSPQLNPQISDFSTIRAYSADTGAILQIFKPGQRPSSCSGQSCMKINQFQTSFSNQAIDGTVHTSFSTSDLFAGKKAFVANELFTKIQRDLEINTVTGIYATKHDWQKVILQDDLNAEQQVLLSQVFEDNDSNTEAGQQAIAAYLGLSYVSTNDDLYNVIQSRIIKSFVEFADKKKIFLRDKGNFNSNKFTKEKNIVANLKDTFLRNRDVYQDLLKSKITRLQAIRRLNTINGNTIDEKTYIVDTNVGNNSTNTGGGNNTNTKPPAPIAPNCMSKKPKNRSNKCKNNVRKYKAALKQYNKKYG